MSTILDPRTFPLHGTRLIEASAGTGKTFTIAALYVRLVLQHGGESAFSRALAPQNILVVTFTNAATEELRDRIRRRLSEAALVFRNLPNAPADDLLLDLRKEFPEEQWPALARRLELASNSMDEAAVHTIHGWAQRMLSQHAFDSGARFNLRLEADDREFYREAARDYWRTFVYPLEPETLESVLACADCPDSLADSLRYWPDSNDAAKADPEFFARVRRWVAEYGQLEEKARKQWLEQAEQIDTWFDQALDGGWLHGGSHKPEATRELLSELHAWSRGELVFKTATHGKLSAQGLRLTKKGSRPELAALQLLDELKACQETAPDIRADLLTHARHWCVNRIEQAKQRRAVLSFDDLLKRLDTALQGPNGEALAELIRQRYPVALIDEFQDTDQVQYRMFRTIYLDRPDTGLFMIGDPKQAIYAFRGADIHTYLQARRDANGQLFTLDTNYRSTQGLVEAVNRIFVHGDRHGDGAFMFRQDIPFSPVGARGRSDRFQVDGEAVPALTVWHDATVRNKASYLSDSAAATACQIVSLLNLAQADRAGFGDGDEFRPLTSADIAILVRDRSEAQAIREALAERGLKSAYLSDRESVYRSREAQDLLLWLQAVASPDSEGRLRVALASPTLGLPLRELDTAGADSSVWEMRVERFLIYRKLWQQKGILVMLSRLLDDFDLPARLLQTEDNRGERSLTNLMQLGELLQQASMGLDGEQALIRYLAERIEEARDSRSEDYVQRLESDEALIKIVTIHKSKGLEYPLVFLPFIGTSRPVDRKGRQFYAWHDETGARQFDYNLTDEGRAQADRERLAEDLRLLYVAVTRARHACWLGLSPLGKQNRTGYSCQLMLSAMGRVLNGNNGIEPGRLADCLEDLASDCSSIRLAPLPEITSEAFTGASPRVSLEPARMAGHRNAAPWWITSYSGVVMGASMSSEQGDQATTEEPSVLAEESAAQAVAEESVFEDRLEPASATAVAERRTLHEFPKGARAGVFLHGVLEWAARQGFGQVLSAPDSLEDQVERRCRRRGLAEWSQPLSHWLLSFLDTPIHLPAGDPMALGQLIPEQTQPELEFWFSISHAQTQALDRLLHEHVMPGQRRPVLKYQVLNGMLKGYIDLVFEHDGRFYVADYKSNWLGMDNSAYTAKNMEAAILEHRYDLQYALYSLALHRLLRARLHDYDYDRHFGGALYLFLRGIDGSGQGVYGVRPPRALIEALDRLFAKRDVQEEARGI